MQTRLDRHINASKPPPSELNLDYVRVNCKLEIEEANMAEYPVVFKRGRWRPLLKHVVGNLWVCPKCGTIHYDRNFYDGFRRKKKKFRCPHCGRRRFRYDRLRGELVCRKCGLVLS